MKIYKSRASFRSRSISRLSRCRRSMFRSPRRVQGDGRYRAEILSAGFFELGTEEGMRLEQEIRDIAAKGIGS